MAPFEGRITLSILDRLTDHAPDSPREAPLTRSQSLRALKASVWRDLSHLLNAKRRETEIPEHFTETCQSLLTFGLPDFSSYTLNSPADQNRLRRAIEAAVRRFEPRLENVTVTLEAPDESLVALRFRIDALLRVDPVPEPVTFETLLQPDSCQFVVIGENR